MWPNCIILWWLFLYLACSQLLLLADGQSNSSLTPSGTTSSDASESLSIKASSTSSSTPPGMSVALSVLSYLPSVTSPVSVSGSVSPVSSYSWTKSSVPVVSDSIGNTAGWDGSSTISATNTTIKFSKTTSTSAPSRTDISSTRLSVTLTTTVQSNPTPTFSRQMSSSPITVTTGTYSTSDKQRSTGATIVSTASLTTEAPPPRDGDKDRQWSTAKIAGIACGISAAVLFFLLIAIYLCVKRPNRHVSTVQPAENVADNVELFEAPHDEDQIKKEGN